MLTVWIPTSISVSVVLLPHHLPLRPTSLLSVSVSLRLLLTNTLLVRYLDLAYLFHRPAHSPGHWDVPHRS